MTYPNTVINMNFMAPQDHGQDGSWDGVMDYIRGPLLEKFPDLVKKHQSGPDLVMDVLTTWVQMKQETPS